MPALLALFGLAAHFVYQHPSQAYQLVLEGFVGDGQAAAGSAKNTAEEDWDTFLLLFLSTMLAGAVAARQILLVRHQQQQQLQQQQQQRQND